MTEQSRLYQLIIDVHEKIRRYVEAQYEQYHVTSIKADTETTYATKDRMQPNPKYILLETGVTFSVEAEYLNHKVNVKVYCTESGVLTIGDVSLIM